MTNVSIYWNNLKNVVSIEDNFPINVESVSVYITNGVVFNLPLNNVRSLRFSINADNVKLNIRRKKSFDKNEVFAIKKKGENIYALYIPYELIGCRYMGAVSYPLGDDYIYEYDTYHLNVTNIAITLFTEGVRSISKRDENTIEVLNYVRSKPTKEREKAIRLCEEIETNCNVRVGTWEMLRILKKYNITRKRGDAR